MTRTEYATRAAEADARKSLGDYAVGLLLVEAMCEDPCWRGEFELWLERMQRRVQERRVARIKVALLDRDGREELVSA